MKKNTIRIIAVLLILMAPLFLSGCKKKCPKPTENIPGTSTFRDDCPYEEATTAGTGQKVLDLWIIYDNTDAFREQVQAFQSNFPGVRVNVKKFTNLPEYEDLVISEIAEGEGPDVFMVHNSWMPKHFKKLYPLPLDQPIVMNAELFRQTFFQAAANDLIIDEQVYGMPLSIDNLAVFYNKQHFKDLIATSDKPGALWEEIKEQTTELTKRDNSPERFALSGMALGRADNISSAVDILYALMLEYGVQFYDEKEERATFATGGGLTGDNPGVQALELFTSFGLPSYRNYSWNEYITGYSPAEKEINPFVRGKVSMIIGYPYLYGEIQTAIQEQQKSGGQHIDIENVGITSFPQLVSGTEATKRDTYASYFPLVVARTTDMPAEAWSLVQFLTSSDALQTYHKITNRPTSRKDMVSEQQTEPLFGTFAFQAPFAKSFKIYDDAAYRKVFTDAIQDVMKNVSSAQQALTAAQQKITCVVQKEKELIDIGTDCGI
ncbi:extracellular solute-binding protein [Patescibacteria group bacterium]|nr:extracellular solute-binding protein [Patescibacteria group bacterium]MBU1015721.1 extracellular solute-binding protein [Patescibacteria group bacterium]MBU1684893.1 extracellular solute-binding protein [Patescibacteria group bacterium]MBU1938649.1 extracellular solute-binding protein [Patescibacteria group bacterium]